MTEKYIQPEFNLKVFTCPHCNVITEQQWNDTSCQKFNPNINQWDYYQTKIFFSKCVACGNITLWIESESKQNKSEEEGELAGLTNFLGYNTPNSKQYQMVYPQVLACCPPSDDMPESVKELYNEARSIVFKSPRGAAALLRLALDKLCNEICEECKQQKYNGKINDKISLLVSKGLTSKLQKAFDFVRVTGNDAVHELGLLDVQDNPEIANALFSILNLIVEKMITENKQIDDLYNLIPESRRDKIEERNKKSKGE